MSNVQEMELSADFRIKFASIDDRGNYRSDASEEYVSLFDEAPENWRVQQTGEVTTRREGQRSAWLLESDTGIIGAVEHETGLEILAIGIATNVAAAAIIGAAAWAWKRWNTSREGKPGKLQSSLECEFDVEIPGGGRRKAKVTYSGPIEDSELRHLLSDAMKQAAGVADP